MQFFSGLSIAISLYNVKKITCKSVCAYQHEKSTTDILLVALDSIADKGDSVCAAFLDLRKAYYSLDHSILLERLLDPVLF